MSDHLANLLEEQDKLLTDIKHEVNILHRTEPKDRRPSIGKLRIASLDLSWKKFKVNHERLNEMRKEVRDRLEYFATGMYEQCRDEYMKTKLEMYRIIESWTPKPSETDHSWPTETPRGQTSGMDHRPVHINFPPFSGSFHEWPKFRKSFSSTIRKNIELRNVEKLFYLKKCLIGQAARLISGIPVSSGNFDYAWTTLVKHYENKRLMVQYYFDTLFAPCPEIRESSADLEKLLTETEECNDALRTVCDPAEIWDLVVAYITARKLDPTSFTSWKREIEPMTSPPTFAHLRQFLNLRIDALRAVEEPSESPTSPDYI